MAAPRSRPPARFELDGLAVYDQEGDGSDPPVVIVHGSLDRASSFGRVSRLLGAVPNRRYDRRGYGRSQAGTAVDLDGHVADLLTVIGERPAVVFGHSIGGTIALVAAIRHPDRFRALALYESPVPGFGAEEKPPSPLLALEPGDAAERFMIAMAGERIWRRLPSGTREDRRHEGPALIADVVIAEETPPIDPGAVDVPVLVAVGERSEAYRHDEARALADALPTSTFTVVDGAVHGVHLGDPAATAALIRRTRDLATF